MFHFCSTNIEFLGLGYNFYETKLTSKNPMGLTYFELYKCKKCGKFIRRNVQYAELLSVESLTTKVELLEQIGYTAIGNLIYGDS